MSICGFVVNGSDVSAATAMIAKITYCTIFPPVSLDPCLKVKGLNRSKEILC